LQLFAVLIKVSLTLTPFTVLIQVSLHSLHSHIVLRLHAERERDLSFTESKDVVIGVVQQAPHRTLGKNEHK
jgi:hypothetical protein